MKLTKRNVDAACLPPKKGETNSKGKPRVQNTYFDSELRGFGVVVGQTAKTFILQKRARDGRLLRVTIGKYGAWTPEQAREKAGELARAIDSGEDPMASRGGPTLRDAVAAHVARLRAKGGSERSVKNLTGLVDTHLAGWLGRHLASITRSEVRDLHAELVKDHGPSLADLVFVWFRAVWNSAAKVHDDLPPNLTVAIEWHKKKRRREPIPWSELPAWRAAIEKLGPVRRDYCLFVLLTGLRSEDAATVRWEDVDLGEKTIHRPRPKGGEDRAFTVPLSVAVVELIAKRKAENEVLFPSTPWVFPCKNFSGEVVPLVERRGGGRSPHRLRDTFATAAHEVGVDWILLKILMNHTLSGGGDVTSGYIKPGLELLRMAAEKVAEFLVARF